MDGCTLCGLLGLFIWDRACHGASKDVNLFDGPHDDSRCRLVGWGKVSRRMNDR